MIFWYNSSKENTAAADDDGDKLPPLAAVEPERTLSSTSSHRRSKSDVSLPAIVPLALVSRSNSDMDTRKRSRKGNGSFYPAAYAGTINGIPKAKEYNSKYKYKHNVYQTKGPYSLTDRNFYGFTHSIDKNKPRKRRHSFPQEEEAEPEEKPVGAMADSKIFVCSGVLCAFLGSHHK